MSKLLFSPNMTKPFYFTATVQVNDCNSFPLMVQCVVKATREDEGWSFEVCNLILVELNVGKKGIDITGDVRADKHMRETIISHVLLQETELYNEVAEIEEV